MNDSDLKSPMLADVKTVKKAPVPTDVIVNKRLGKFAKWDWRHWFMAACGVVFALSVLRAGHSMFFYQATVMNVAGYIAIISTISTFVYCMISVDND